MIVEKQLEQIITDAIREDGVYYCGPWQSCEDGMVKGDEPAHTGAVISVLVAPRRMDSYAGGIPEVVAEIPVEISCAMSTDCDPTGVDLLGLYERAAAKVWTWVRDCNCEVRTDLTVSHDGADVFVPGGVMQTSGTPPTYSAASRLWFWNIGFTIKGIIKE